MSRKRRTLTVSEAEWQKAVVPDWVGAAAFVTVFATILIGACVGLSWLVWTFDPDLRVTHAVGVGVVVLALAVLLFARPRRK